MKLYRFSPFAVPKTFTFKDPDTQFVYTASSFPSLLSHIRSYRAQNQLEELEFLEFVVEHYLCMLRENAGACVPRQTLRRGIMSFIRGGIGLLSNVAYNSFATQAVADARAEICIKCPKNVFPDKGPFVRYSDRLAEAAVGARKSRYHNELGNCEACGCPLRAKVFFNEQIELTKEQAEQAPEYCWQRRENQNTEAKPKGV